MKFVEMTVTTTCEAEELVADLLWSYTESGVAVSSVRDVINLSRDGEKYDYIDEKLFVGNDGVSLVKAFFTAENSKNAIESIRRDFETLRKNAEGNIEVGTLETGLREIEGDDWIAIWKKHFKPFKVASVVVCPQWIKYEGDEAVVRIGSNNAFGTGEHETTYMCIEELCASDLHGRTVLDVGSGSGILGIAAAKLGAKKVCMTEIDERAVAASVDNILLNGVESVCSVKNSGVLACFDGVFDVVVANLTAEIITMLMAELEQKTADGGKLILSGILKDRVDKLENRLLSVGYSTINKKTVNEWCLLVLEKR